MTDLILSSFVPFDAPFEGAFRVVTRVIDEEGRLAFLLTGLAETCSN